MEGLKFAARSTASLEENFDRQEAPPTQKVKINTDETAKSKPRAAGVDCRLRDEHGS